MAVRLYVTASEATIQEIAGVSPELAIQIRALDATYQAARIEAKNQGPWRGEQDQDPRYLAYVAYNDAMGPLGPNADLYANLAYGDGFNRFQGRRLVSNEDFRSVCPHAASCCVNSVLPSDSKLRRSVPIGNPI